jgi:hypothetical protein
MIVVQSHSDRSASSMFRVKVTTDHSNSETLVMIIIDQRAACLVRPPLRPPQ